jgi:hypothetical protein
MSRIISILICGLVLTALSTGCSRKKDQPRPGAAGHAEEIADSTRLDSAVTGDGETTPVQDSTPPKLQRGYR